MKCILGLAFIIYSGFVSAYVIFPFPPITTNLDTRLFYNFFHHGTNHIIAHPNDETKFIMSSHGIKHTMLCPVGTKFDTELRICNHKLNSPHLTGENSITDISSSAKQTAPLPTPEEKEYKKWLEGCSPFDEMPYFNKSTNSYDCFPTLNVGPCKLKEWFVLNKDDPKHAICVEQKCACGPKPEYSYDYEDEGDESESESECALNIQEEGYIYIDFNGECVESRATKPCPFGQWLVPDVFGDANCDCADNYLHHYDQDGVLTCYQEFLRGPCKEGEQYIPVEEEYSFQPKCAPTNCDDKNQIRYKDVCITVPKCKENQGVKLPSEKHPEAKCINGLGERSGLISGSKSCPSGKKKDSKGKCRKTIGSKNSKGKRGTGTKGGVHKVCCG